MRILLIPLVFLSFLLNAQENYWALIKTNCNDYAAARELRQELAEEGHLVSLIYQPQWMVARLRLPPASIRERYPQVLAIGAGAGSSPQLNAPTTLAVFFEKMAVGGFDPIQKDKPHETTLLHFSETSCVTQPPVEKNLTHDIPLYDDFNSEFFKGIVAVSVFFIESDGSEDPNYYSWTQAALEEEKLDILMALHTWAYTAYLFGADLTFIPVWFDNRPEVNQGFEPNIHLGSFDFYPIELNKMTGSVLQHLGYSEPYVRAQADHHSYDQQQIYHSDFSFVIGVHYSHQGKGFIRANALIGGPITYLSRDYDYRVYGHEIGHIFHAFDEYLNTQNCEPWASSFNGAINGNNLSNDCREKQPCVMNDNAVLGRADELHFAVCSYTASHFGWGENDLAPAPHILSTFQEPFSFPFIQLSAEFPEFREPLQGYVKVWLKKNGRDSLIISDDLGFVSGTKQWTNTQALLPGEYKCIFYHGRKWQNALIPSKPAIFQINYTPVFPFRDTCIYFCRTPEPISFPQSNLRWYGDRQLQTVVHEGGEFIPDFLTDSTLYLAQYDEEGPVDVARVHILFGRPAGVNLLSRIEGDGKIALSLYSFLPIPNIAKTQWFRNGELFAQTDDWTIYVQDPGIYYAKINNGCLIQSDSLRLILPPVVSQKALCEQLGYQLIATGENIQWYNDRQFPISNEDTLTVTNIDRYQFYFVTQTIEGVESPLYEIALAPLYEDERIDLINTHNYLRIKGPGPTVDWWRNDTLFLPDGPMELTPPLPGVYQVSFNNFADCRKFSNTSNVQFRTPPPIIEKQYYSYCMQSRENPDEFKGQTARAEGQHLRWYYGPEKEELINIGPTYKINYSDFKGNVRLFVTQTINGEESPPAVIFTNVVFPMDLTIDTIGGALYAVMNGEDANLLPAEYLFQWYLNDLPIDQATDEWFYPGDAGGWYTVDILNLTEHCLTKDSILLNVPTDVKETLLEEKVTVFPNPARDLFFIQFEQPGEKDILLYDGNGRLLRRYHTFDQMLEVNGTGLPAGLYLLRCRMHTGREVVKKLIRQ